MMALTHFTRTPSEATRSSSTQLQQSLPFRDAYRILEELRRLQEPQEPVAVALSHCHKTLEHLERVSRIVDDFTPAAVNARGRSRTDDDPFQFRQRLDAFIATCHSCLYVLRPIDADSTHYEAGCLPHPQRLVRKRRQSRGIVEDLLDHWRSLTLVLTSIIYTTSQEAQRHQPVHDPDIAAILRQVEKRHGQFENLNICEELTNTPKANFYRFESLDWDFCLRQFFDMFEDHQGSLQGRSVSASSPSVNSSISTTQWPRRPDAGLRASSYRRHPMRRTTSSESIQPASANQYYRSPRIRVASSGVMPKVAVLNAPSRRQTVPLTKPRMVRTNSSPSPSSVPSSKLGNAVTPTFEVIEAVDQQAAVRQTQSAAQKGNTGLGLIMTPIDTKPLFEKKKDKSPAGLATTEVPWERLALDLGGAMISDLILKYPGIWQRQQEVIWSTRNMTAQEARDHIRHAFAVFPDKAIEILEQRLAIQKKPPPSRMFKVQPVIHIDRFESRACSTETAKVVPQIGAFQFEGESAMLRGVEKTQQDDARPKVKRTISKARKARPSIRSVVPSGQEHTEIIPQISPRLKQRLADRGINCDQKPTNALNPASAPIHVVEKEPSTPTERMQRLLATPPPTPPAGLPNPLETEAIIEVQEMSSSISTGPLLSQKRLSTKRSSLFEIAGCALAPRPMINKRFKPKMSNISAPELTPAELALLMTNKKNGQPRSTAVVDIFDEEPDHVDDMVLRKELRRMRAAQRDSQLVLTPDASPSSSPLTPKSPSRTKRAVVNTLRTVDHLRSSQMYVKARKPKAVRASFRGMPPRPLSVISEPANGSQSLINIQQALAEEGPDVPKKKSTMTDRFWAHEERSYLSPPSSRGSAESSPSSSQGSTNSTGILMIEGQETPPPPSVQLRTPAKQKLDNIKPRDFNGTPPSPWWSSYPKRATPHSSFSSDSFQCDVPSPLGSHPILADFVTSSPISSLPEEVSHAQVAISAKPLPYLISARRNARFESGLYNVEIPSSDLALPAEYSPHLVQRKPTRTRKSAYMDVFDKSNRNSVAKQRLSTIRTVPPSESEAPTKVLNRKRSDSLIGIGGSPEDGSETAGCPGGSWLASLMDSKCESRRSIIKVMGYS